MKEIKSVDELKDGETYHRFDKYENGDYEHSYHFCNIELDLDIFDYGARLFGPIPNPTLEDIEKQCKE